MNAVASLLKLFAVNHKLNHECRINRIRHQHVFVCVCFYLFPYSYCYDIALAISHGFRRTLEFLNPWLDVRFSVVFSIAVPFFAVQYTGHVVVV